MSDVHWSCTDVRAHLNVVCGHVCCTLCNVEVQSGLGCLMYFLLVACFRIYWFEHLFVRLNGASCMYKWCLWIMYWCARALDCGVWACLLYEMQWLCNGRLSCPLHLVSLLFSWSIQTRSHCVHQLIVEWAMFVAVRILLVTDTGAGQPAQQRGKCV
jgi:hypothetical protein